jgi:acetyl esterase/lipase
MKTSIGFLLVLTLFIPTIAFSADPAPVKPSPNGPKFKRVMPQTPPGFTLSTYTIATYDGHDVVLTVYVPDKPGVYPTILDIHGGGWSARQVENDKPMMERLAVRGFVTALIAYRLSSEAKYPAALSDCKSAVRYLRANAAKFKLDPDRIGVMGGSAGGHLTGLFAMTNGLPEFEGEGPNPGVSSSVKAAIVMAGPMDLVTANLKGSGLGSITFFGGDYKAVPDVYKTASPITHVRPGVPPTIFIEGEKDSVKIGRAEMQEKLKALNIETGLYTLKDAPHPFWMSQPWLDETVQIAGDFFKKQLGEPK